MKILVYPWDKNPYQQQLYSALKRTYPDTRVRYAFRFPFIWWLALPVWLVAYRLMGYRVLHMHWPKLEVAVGPVRVRQWLSVRSYHIFLPLIKRLGYTVVWTIHNVVPHEPQTADDQTLSRYLAAIADGKIVHSPYTLAQMEAIGMDTANTTVIPHGNYDGSYPDGISRAAARKQLGLQKNDFAILFFGKIRQYKGVEGLLAAFQALQLPHTRLIIAGQNDTVESDAAIRAASQHAAISYYPGHVADADVATYFKACDIVCLPFTSITTSGSVLLALTFGKPLIAPQTGALTDIPAAAGYIYDPALPGALQQTLHTAIVQHHTLLTKGKAARAYADTLSWDKLATKTYDFYVRLLERK